MPRGDVGRPIFRPSLVLRAECYLSDAPVAVSFFVSRVPARNGPLRRWLAVAALAAAASGCGGGVGEGGPVLPVEPPPPARVNAYTDAELGYFAEIAPGFEFSALPPVIRKWRYDVTLRPGPGVRPDERRYLDSLAAELTGLIGGAVRVLVAPGGSVDVDFLSDADFARWVPPDVAPRVGAYFSVQVDASQHLFAASAVIRAGLDPLQRRRLLREEVTQLLGLGQDSWRYPESTFYQGGGSAQAFLPIDRALVEMLYRPEVTAGMTAEQAVAVLRGLTRRARS